MNEIKFACPHCGQHIACDAGYCGYQIGCPACGGGLIVPRLASFGYGAAGNLSLALPVATPVPRMVAAGRLSRHPNVWSEQEWNRHEAELDKTGRSGAPLHAAFFFILIAPVLTGLLGYSHGLGRAIPVLGVPLQVVWMVFSLGCSLVCAIILSRQISGNALVRGVFTLFLGFALHALNVTIALFLGCTAELMGRGAP